MDLQLRGKRALVTGASSGIGTAIAKTLAGEGVAIVVHGRNEGRARAVASEISAGGGKAAIAIGDLSTDAGAESVAKAADEAFGGIDILVNNAAAPTEPSRGLGMFDLEPADWTATFERNINSAYRLSKYFVPQMKDRHWGRIVQITSGLAYSPRGMQGDYSSSKAALNNFTFNLSRAVANTGITVNNVCPGMTVTPVLQEWILSIAEANGLGRDLKKGEEFVLQNMVKLSVPRLGQPQDIANAVAFIVSPLAEYVTGTTLRVDGGSATAVT
jgi:3-oxoacyl-[acyl-carrier protein] reductase